MIDHIKYRDYLYNSDWLIEKFNVSYKVEPNTNDKVKCYPIRHVDGPITLDIIKANNGTIFLKLHGSIHKYYNYITTGKEINYNDFTIDQIHWTINYLCDKYKLSFIDPRQQYLVSVEFGFNIETTFAPAPIVDYDIILHKEKDHNTDDKYIRGGKSKTFVLTNYILKIYDKGIESKLPYHLLRIETIPRNKRTCKRHGINQLANLYDRTVIDSLYETLIDQIKNTTIIDGHRLPKEATDKEKEVFNVFKSKALLRDQRHGPQQISRKTIKRRKAIFQATLEKYDLLKVKKEIIQGVNSQYKKLSQVNRNHVIEIAQPRREESIQVNGNHAIEPILETCEERPKETETTIHIDGSCLPIPKYCLITGIDISHQQPDSKYLSVRTLLDLSRSKPELFETIRQKYESKTGRKRNNINDTCIHLSHQIRDRIRPYKRRCAKYANSIFPYESVLSN